ncbi:hypothetical protein NX871_28120 [Burkholderia thailandensis]|uniref:hypothetical protein n=1 Tax=Burkholderia thailandensis TaxID=57975 RepID=UPI00217D0EF3|nr:hypothetical protein [Burkholderia thailandensis]MCS6473780.1 hypothetical protein [Burkholderia thailandensis]
MAIHANKSQIFAAYQNLTPEELGILSRCGDRFAQSTLFDGALDLMHEALSRLLTGQRKWPMHVEFGCFLLEVMRSIAFAERTRIEALPGRKVEFDDGSLAQLAALDTQSSPEKSAIASEERALAARELARAQKSLKDDEQASAVLKAMLDGLTPSEIRERCGLSPMAYELARQRVMWRLNALRVCRSERTGAKPHPSAPASSRAASPAERRASPASDKSAETPSSSSKKPSTPKRDPRRPKR